MREACKFNVEIHNGNILMSSVTKDPGVSSILLFSGSSINFPHPLYCGEMNLFKKFYHLPNKLDTKKGVRGRGWGWGVIQNEIQLLIITRIKIQTYI
jgi:hypothetical protein